MNAISDAIDCGHQASKQAGKKKKKNFTESMKMDKEKRRNIK